MITSAPNFVDFNITDKCNMSCLHCYIGESSSQEIEISAAKKIVKDLSDLGVFKIAFTGGDPFLYSHWKELFAYTDNLDMEIMVNTNATTLSTEDIEYIYKKYENRIHFAISLDGYSPKSYSLLRKLKNNKNAENEFNKLLENSKLLDEKNMKITFNFTYTEITKDNVFKISKFIKDEFKNKYNLNIIKFGQTGNGKSNKDLLEVNYSNWKNFLISTTEEKMKNNFKNVTIEPTCPWEFYLPLSNYNFELIENLWGYTSPLRNEVYSRIRTLGCHAGISNIAINWNGDVYPCGLYPTGEILKLGNALKTDIGTIWNNSPKLNIIRNLSLEEIGEPCISCKYKKICGGGCRGAAVMINKNLKGVDSRCPLI